MIHPRTLKSITILLELKAACFDLLLRDHKLPALLNLYAIFYFKSSSLLVSFAFLGVLVAVLLANELRRIKAFGLAVKF